MVQRLCLLLLCPCNLPFSQLLVTLKENIVNIFSASLPCRLLSAIARPSNLLPLRCWRWCCLVAINQLIKVLCAYKLKPKKKRKAFKHYPCISIVCTCHPGQSQYELQKSLIALVCLAHFVHRIQPDWNFDQSSREC